MVQASINTNNIRTLAVIQWIMVMSKGIIMNDGLDTMTINIPIWQKYNTSATSTHIIVLHIQISRLDEPIDESLPQVEVIWVAVSVAQDHDDPQEEEVGSDLLQHGVHLHFLLALFPSLFESFDVHGTVGRSCSPVGRSFILTIKVIEIMSKFTNV